jgi:hypothetical protein
MGGQSGGGGGERERERERKRGRAKREETERDLKEPSWISAPSLFTSVNFKDTVVIEASLSQIFNFMIPVHTALFAAKGPGWYHSYGLPGTGVIMLPRCAWSVCLSRRRRLEVPFLARFGLSAWGLFARVARAHTGARRGRPTPVARLCFFGYRELDTKAFLSNAIFGPWEYLPVM